MASVMEIMQLCRLCLVKDEVNIPIFEEKGDLRQIFLKISACLPVKVSREDNLPKNICDGCSYKLELLYEFWNTSANSEKQLLKWLSQVGIKKTPTSDKVTSVKVQPHSINSDNVVLKQEVVDLGDSHGTDDDLEADDLNVSNDAQDYILQQQQLPYQPVTFEFQQEGFTGGEATSSTAGPTSTITSEAAEVAPKRKRRAAAMKALPPHIDSEEEDDVDLVETKIAKTEEQSDDSAGEDPEPTTFVGLPSTSTDNEQPGPSGVGKGAAEAPLMELQYDSVVKTEIPSVHEIPNCWTTDTTVALDDILWRYCRRCPEKFKTERELRNHGNRVHQKRTLSCPICGRLFKFPFEVKIHAVSHTAEKLLFKCEECGKLLRSKYTLRDHAKRHANDFIFKCDVCAKGFISKTALNEHSESHQNITMKCPECNKQFKNRQYFIFHVKTHRPDYKPRVFACMECGSKLTSTQSFNRHMRTHKADNKYVCDICGKHITSAGSLRDHMLIHSGEKPFVCEVCGKQFNHKKLLRVHMRVHTKEKPYSCNVCNKRFTQRSTLTVHIKMHTGEKPYKCEICPKQFVTKTLLRMHAKVHGIALADIAKDLKPPN